MARLDAGFHQGYGMTETGGNVTFLGPAEHKLGASGDAAALASAGRPHDGVEVRIACADSDSGVGEILVRGPQVAVGFWPDLRPTTVDGENVASREVEDVLSTHPDVEHVAVVGVPDELIGHVRSRIAAFKRPRHVLFVDALPLTTNGKVARDTVRTHARSTLHR